MMSERLGGCVDAELKVYGVKGLRVVDASVMPLIVGGGLQATVYAVAERGADLIRGRKPLKVRRNEKETEEVDETEDGTEAGVDGTDDNDGSGNGEPSANRLGGFTWGFPRRRA
ncbi:hypothetical protein B0H65DRAFT_492459 [Neurospora tetraspora]|uniref:Glucose-methanol-choline oxidoreductase C-terminal domain-containing protein n=1 Tax=Neurospora tetraspora TaxID=94610 RepID=A0AAE0MUQ0_9PEZI|nr:hypothetical protein B0H65DRAFT_492459 [Neurospora tetraspora]